MFERGVYASTLMSGWDSETAALLCLSRTGRTNTCGIGKMGVDGQQGSSRSVGAKGEQVLMVSSLLACTTRTR